MLWSKEKVILLFSFGRASLNSVRFNNGKSSPPFNFAVDTSEKKTMGTGNQRIMISLLLVGLSIFCTGGDNGGTGQK